MARVLVAYAPTRVGRNKDGDLHLDINILSTVKDVEDALQAGGHVVERATLRRDTPRFRKVMRRFRPNVIFNLCESVGGRSDLEKNAAALFELWNVPFTGNSCLALGLCQNKHLAKLLLKSARIPTPDFIVARKHDEDPATFPVPAIVKPAESDGSLGISARSVVKTQKALRNRIQYVHRRFKQPALVEQYVRGREFQVSVVGDQRPSVLAVAELSYRGLPPRIPRICSYSAKWKPDSAYFKYTNPIVPARIPEALREKLESMALRTYITLGLSGYARVDFRKAAGKPMVIDVNPNPDISADAGFAKAGLAAGLDYPSLISMIVELAIDPDAEIR